MYFWLAVASWNLGFSSAGAPLQWAIHPIEPEGTNKVTLYDVAFGMERFLAIGLAGDIYSAPGNDPQRWTSAGRFPDVDLWTIIFASGRFVAAGQDTKTSSGVCLSSTDRTNWTRQLFEVVPRWWDAAHGNGWFVMVGDDAVARSTNAVDWMIETNLVLDSTVPFRTIDFVNGEFLGTFLRTISDPVPYSPKAMAFSADGANWVKHDVWPDEGYNEIAYGRKVYVSRMENDCCGWASYSADGRNWHEAEFPGSWIGHGLEYANGVFAMTASEGGSSSVFLSSTNGTEWEDIQVATDGLFFYGLAFGRGRFVAVGHHWSGKAGAVAISAPAGEDRRISNVQMKAGTVEFDFNAEERMEWRVEASDNLSDWVLVQEIEGTSAGPERVSVPWQGKAACFLRLSENK